MKGIGLIDSTRRGHATPKYHNATFKVFTKASCIASLALLCYEHITSSLLIKLKGGVGMAMCGLKKFSNKEVNFSQVTPYPLLILPNYKLTRISYFTPMTGQDGIKGVK